MTAQSVSWSYNDSDKNVIDSSWGRSGQSLVTAGPGGCRLGGRSVPTEGGRA